MKNVNNKETQGSIKMKQYLEDLKRNKYFRKELNKYIKNYEKLEKHELGNPRKSDIIDNLFDKYMELGKITKKIIKKHERNSWQGIIKKMAEKYAIDDNLFSYISFPAMTKGLMSESPNAQLDMCNFKDNYDDKFGIEHGVFSAIPIILAPAERNHYRAYPLSIDIHRFASKRDILDYVEKKWWLIETALSSYNGSKPRFRKRKFNRKLLDFIWENKNLDIKKLKLEMDKKFPKNWLVYYEIYQLIRSERIRRMQELNVGQ